MSPRHRDQSGEWERKHNNTLVRTVRRSDPNFAVGLIRSDAYIGTLKEKLSLPSDTSENKLKIECKKRQAKR
jgi:hypothetical protein